MMLDEFLSSSFCTMSHRERIERLAWFLHAGGKSVVRTGDIRLLYERAHVAAPNISQYLKDLTERKPKIFIKSSDGYRLEANVRHKLAAELSEVLPNVEVSRLLQDTAKKVVVSYERAYLEEAFSCYKVNAFRAAIVMVWNLAYSHIESWILNDAERVTKFNASYTLKFPKRLERLTDRESFSDFKEFDVIETIAHAKLISKNVAEILKEKLKRRNAAAHPSLVQITQAQADDVITDLVNNLVGKLV